MKNINITSVKNTTLTGSLILIAVCLTVMFLVNNALAFITAGVYFLIGLTGYLATINKDKYFPVPIGLKKWVLINIILKVEIFLAKLLKINTDNIMQYFIFLNNRLNPETHGKNILLLLPRCIQEATCSRDLTLDIKNCKKCGRCQIADILRIVEPKTLEVRLVGGGTLALKKVSKINPNGIIAIACEKELIDGIKEVLHVPVWALKNLRPNGPCLNTKIHIEELEEVLEKQLAENKG